MHQVITRSEAIEIMYRPNSEIDPETMQRLKLRFLKCDEAQFIAAFEKSTKKKIDRLIKNRYIIS